MRLRDVASVDPNTPGFSRADSGTRMTFLPLELVWHDTRFDPSQTIEFDGDTKSYTRVIEGDVLVPKVAPTFAHGRVALARDLLANRALATSEVFVVRTEDRAAARFLQYRLQAKDVLGQGVASWTGVAGLKRISSDFLRNVLICSATWKAREVIADFLDAETARIDALVGARERQSDLLAERAATVASAFSLCGVTPGVGYRSSGIAPIGQIPKHWRTLRNKVFLREIADLSLDGSEELLTVSHLTGVTPRAEKTGVTMFKAESTIGYKRCAPGDLVINTMWAWMGALGVTRQHGIVSPAYGVYRFDREIACPAYFELVFRSPAYVAEMTRYSKGVWTSRLRLYPEVFLALRAPVPTLSEQRSIVLSIGGQTKGDADLRDGLRRSTALLRERRQALITAAVTGELQVPRTTTANAAT